MPVTFTSPNEGGFSFSLGAIIALIILILCILLGFFLDRALKPVEIFFLIGGLALARLT